MAEIIVANLFAATCGRVVIAVSETETISDGSIHLRLDQPERGPTSSHETISSRHFTPLESNIFIANAGPFLLVPSPQKASKVNFYGC